MSQPTYRQTGVFVLGSWIILSAAGCGTSAFDRRIVQGELDAQQLVERMQAGETTCVDEQAFILKNLDAWREVGEGRDLTNPMEEGPLAADFQAAVAKAPNSAFRQLVWAWLQLAVTNPGLDPWKGAVEAAASMDVR